MPFVTVGLLAAALLAGLIYWGASSPDAIKAVSGSGEQKSGRVEEPHPATLREKEPRASSPASSPSRQASASPAAKRPDSPATVEPPPFKPVPAPVSAPPASAPSREETPRTVAKEPSWLTIPGTAPAAREETPPAVAKGGVDAPASSAPPEEKPRDEKSHLALATHPKIPIPAPAVPGSGMESKSSTPPPPPPSQAQPSSSPPVARVAIVIDDFGQSIDVARKFLDLPFPVTFSVLPYLDHSQEVIRMAHAHGREVMLHLPMEPQEYPKVNPGRGALLVSMTDEQILQATQVALDASPHIVGVNNHMGSRFTESTGQMKVVLAELQRRGLFFLDSQTSEKSVGYRLAGEMRLPGARRDIFLDHDTDLSAVRAQVERLIRKARIEGRAIAIGHIHESTLKALREAADRFSQEKIAVVSAGELVRERER